LVHSPDLAGLQAPGLTVAVHMANGLPSIALDLRAGAPLLCGRSRF
jgi:hypothetical protein